jgi:hypothetical protein
MKRIALLFWLTGALLAAPAATTQKHWSEIDNLKAENATVITKDGQRHRGRLLITPTGAIVTHHGAYEQWLTQPKSPEIPKASIAGIVVRSRYKLTADEQHDLWWYVFGDWKAIFFPQLSNLFPIAIVANAGVTGWAIVYTPFSVIATLVHPPASDTIEILPE